MFESAQALETVLKNVADTAPAPDNITDNMVKNFSEFLLLHQEEFNNVLRELGAEEKDLKPAPVVIFAGNKVHLSKHCRVLQGTFHKDASCKRLLQPTDVFCDFCSLDADNYEESFVGRTGSLIAEFTFNYYVNKHIRQTDLPGLSSKLDELFSFLDECEMWSYAANDFDFDADPQTTVDTILQHLAGNTVSILADSVRLVKEAFVTETFRNNAVKKLNKKLGKCHTQYRSEISMGQQVLKIGANNGLLAALIRESYPEVAWGGDEEFYKYVVVPGDVASVCLDFSREFSSDVIEYIPATNLLLATTAVRLHEDYQVALKKVGSTPLCSTLQGAYQVAQATHK